MTENNFQIDSAAISDRGLSKKRPQNEDSFLELNKQGLFAVADGVGGAQAGDVASQMAMEILGEAFINLHENTDAEEMMKIAVERANEAIYQMSHDLAQLSTMATTIVALHLAGNIATIGHVGDSRIYRLDTKGLLHRETQDHSVVEEEVRAGRMTAAQALHHPSRNVISRALGADSTVEVDMKTIMFEPETTFLLCSDGITRHIQDVELRELLLSPDSPAEIAQRMKEICYERGAEDNLTAVIARVTNSLAGNFAPEQADVTNEYEEPTIATARPGLVSANSVVENQAPVMIPHQPDDETPTGEFRMPAPPVTLQNEQISHPEPTMVTTPGVSVGKTKTAPAAKTEIEDDVRSYRIDEGSSGTLGKILSSMLWLIVGGLLGAGLFYFFQQRNKPVEAPVITQMQTPNILYTAFEDNRRNVDKNPAQYISANGTIPPDDAEGLYLMGRAYLLEERYPEAKQMFLQARDRLAQAKEVNAKTLANEITMSLAIIGNPFSQKVFHEEINLSKPGANSQTNSNSNANQ